MLDPNPDPTQIRGAKRVRVWPMGTLPNETRGVPFEESVISAGDIFFGASGVVHEVLTLKPLSKASPLGRPAAPVWPIHRSPTASRGMVSR